MGHAGTLDPPATGLLVVLVGRATRLARFVATLPKRYTGTIRLGWETTTDDAAGAPVGERDESWRARTRADLERALTDVQRQEVQMPPPVSAKKVDGVRAYRRFRRGETVTLQPVRVQIHALTLVGFDPAAGEAVIDVACSSGTYVRSIARDAGRALGSRAHLAQLRRTGIGPWDVKDALGMDALSALSPQPSAALRPMREAIAHLPALILPAAAAQRFASGQRISTDAPSGATAVFDANGLVGVADVADGVLHPDVVLVG